MLRWGCFTCFGYGRVRAPGKCSEVLAASPSTITQPISLDVFYGPSAQASMAHSEESLVASVEPEPIGTLAGCLVPALPARCSMKKDVVKGVHKKGQRLRTT